MHLLHSPPRFGLDGDQLYDYVAKQYVPVGTIIESSAGSWDTGRVADLIRQGQPVESAFIPAPVSPDQSTAQANAQLAPPADPIDQANKDFNSSLPPNDPAVELSVAAEEFERAIGQPSDPIGTLALEAMQPEEVA